MRQPQSLIVTAVLCCTVALAACSARPHPNPQAVPTADVSPRGSQLLTSLVASDSAVEMHLQRSVPGPSGEGTVSVEWQFLWNGPDNQIGPSFVEGDGPDLVFDVVTYGGSIVAIKGGAVQAIGGIKQPGGVHGGYSSSLVFPLPRDARWLRVTAHVGLTKPEAARGYSTKIPVSSIPVVTDLSQVHISIPPRVGF